MAGPCLHGFNVTSAVVCDIMPHPSIVSVCVGLSVSVVCVCVGGVHTHAHTCAHAFIEEILGEEG